MEFRKAVSAVRFSLCFLFLFVHAGALWLPGLLSSWGAQASHCGGFSYCSMWDLPRPGVKPVSLAWPGGFYSVEPQGSLFPSPLKMEENILYVSPPCLPLFEDLTETPSWGFRAGKIHLLMKRIWCSYAERISKAKMTLKAPSWPMRPRAYIGLNENEFPQECPYSTADIISWPITKVSIFFS